ncbi:hypothetical protein H9638_01780 [Arthrobacter sp. Sa2BUA2]|uniref:Uncharacterized protein n=1 Tax=Arthrobacter pullicola TaxID=2762224 RepID=A0ABR8YE80_9MICC|nr:hypothetical protein [Arthrobacter pullicola]MBD8042532.1 hypothetical protein [Arthrobacter pullicola]
MAMNPGPGSSGGGPKIDWKRTLWILAGAFIVSSLLIILFPGLGTLWRLAIMALLFVIVVPMVDKRRRK